MDNDRKYWENPNWPEKRNPNFYQLHRLNRFREKIAVKLAPWAIRNDLLNWYKSK